MEKTGSSLDGTFPQNARFEGALERAGTSVPICGSCGGWVGG